MSKALKRLYLGDVVKSFGTKQLRKLTTEEPTESIVGTWRFNDVLSLNDIDVTDSYATYDIEFKFTNINYGTTVIASGLWFSEYNNNLADMLYIVRGDENYNYTAYESFKWRTGRNLPIEIIGGNDVNDAEFTSWLKANATKIA